MNPSSLNSSPQALVSAKDGKWHHICATWENTAGSWRWFKNGRAVGSGNGLKRGGLYSENILY